MSVFRLPRVASDPASPACARRIEASISLVVVLPFEPVIAISAGAKRSRQCRPRRPSAAPRIVGDRELAAAPRPCVPLVDQRGGRAALLRDGEEFVAVEALAANGDEQLAPGRSSACPWTPHRSGRRARRARACMAAAASARLIMAPPGGRAPPRPPRHRKTAGARRRSPGIARAPCRRSAPRRPRPPPRWRNRWRLRGRVR